MALDPSLPFARAHAVAAGVSRRRLEGPTYQRLFQGVYVGADVTVTPAVRVRGALLAVEGAAAYGVTAAELRGLPVPTDEDTHLLVPPDAPRCRRAGIVVHRGVRRLSSHLGLPLTTTAETFVDVAAEHPLVDAVVLGDAIVREGYASPAQLVRASAGTSRRGAPRARRAAALVRPRVASPPETRLRLLVVLGGLPEPATGYEVRVAGRTRYLDLAYPDWRVAVEYDGRHHVERDLQWSDDVERREDLDHESWRVVTVTGLQMWQPERVLGRIRRALHTAGAPLPPASQQWRRHFPHT